MIPRITAAAIVLTTLAALSPSVASAASDRTDVYRSDQGSVRYQVHLPPQYRSGQPMPVMVALHGCSMTGYGLNSMKDMTRFNDLADREGFLVVYPTQSLLRNAKKCWNSLDPAHQFRGRGEPELVAGVAKKVVRDYGADPGRVHVVGASSGAGLAVILAATYPDVFATAASVAGGEYGFHQVDPENPGEVSPVDTGKQAWAQMGSRARQLPLLVFQGDRDTTVPPMMAQRLVTQWSVVNDLAADGSIDGDVDDRPDSVTRFTPPDQYPYTRRTYTDRGDGRTLIDYYLVEGMGHAWSGPTGTGLFSDRKGPDMSRIVWDFARHSSLQP